jgi:hypothetical protein
MLFLYIFAILTIVLLIILIYKLQRPEPKEVIREVIVKEDPYVYWMPWAWGWGGGASHVVRPRPHFAGLGTEHAQRKHRRNLH